jgi:hypothetical protein
VHVDQKRLRQILINLLSNAIKYRKARQPSSPVRYRGQVAEFEVGYRRQHSCARMSSNGVFEGPSRRGQGGDVRAIPGTGLGLTIRKLLTQIMGGEINATSTEEREARSPVRLAAVQRRRAEMPTVSTPQAYAHGHQLRGPRRRKLLLIDDDPSHIDIVQNLLQPLDFSFTRLRRRRARAAAPSQISP